MSQQQLKSYWDTPCLQVSFDILEKLGIEPKTLGNKASGPWCGSFLAIFFSWKGGSWLFYFDCIVAVCVLCLFLVELWVGLKSVITAFPRYTQLLCINAEIYFLLQGTS